MIDMARIFRAEVALYSALADVEERPWGFLFYNTDNPSHYDANHAMILDWGGDLEAIADEVSAFYRGKGLVPRFYGTFGADEVARLGPILLQRGFQFVHEPIQLLIQRNPSRVQPNPELAIRRVTRMEPAIVELVQAEEPDEWAVKGIARALRSPNVHLLVGYLGEVAVTMALLVLMSGASTVNEVRTHPAHRGRGYARTLMHHLVAYHRSLSPNLLYLLANNPTAIRVYQDAGFTVEGPVLDCWMAYQP